eukprot:COSAG01_NODE_6094_length_3853_cov_2.669241_7_plen_356_part_00
MRPPLRRSAVCCRSCLSSLIFRSAATFFCQNTVLYSCFCRHTVFRRPRPPRGRTPVFEPRWALRAAPCHGAAAMGACRPVLLSVLFCASATGLSPNKCTAEQRRELGLGRNSTTPTCHVFNVWGVGAYIPPGDDSADEDMAASLSWRHKKWAEGIQLYRQHANAGGGLRLGKDSVGYVDARLAYNLTRVEYQRGRDIAFLHQYEAMCGNSAVDAVLGPVDASDELQILQSGVCAGKPLLAAGAIDPLYTQQHDNVWSLYHKRNFTMYATWSVGFLHSLGARTFAIAGVDDECPRRRLLMEALKAAVAQAGPNTVLTFPPSGGSCITANGTLDACNSDCAGMVRPANEGGAECQFR